MDFVSLKLDARIRRVVYNNLSEVRPRNRHFSFIVDGNKIVCWGHNEIFRTHPLAARFLHRFSDIHSELAALSRFPFETTEMSKFRFLNVRVRRADNMFGHALPCERCTNMLRYFGLKQVIYTNHFGEWRRAYLGT